MTNMRLIAILAVTCGSLFAQSAVVYTLSPADAAEGLRLNKEREKANQAFDAWKEKLERKLAGSKEWMPWTLDFTMDFRYAIPHKLVAQFIGDAWTNGKNEMDGVLVKPGLFSDSEYCGGGDTPTAQNWCMIQRESLVDSPKKPK